MNDLDYYRTLLILTIILFIFIFLAAVYCVVNTIFLVLSIL